MIKHGNHLFLYGENPIKEALKELNEVRALEKSLDDFLFVMPPTFWEFVATLPAHRQSNYDMPNEYLNTKKGQGTLEQHSGFLKEIQEDIKEFLDSKL